MPLFDKIEAIKYITVSNTKKQLRLLSIVETLREFRTILLVQQIKVHTDHKNSLYQILMQKES